MKAKVYLTTFIFILIISCQSKKISILNGAFLGMTQTEYYAVFPDKYYTFSLPLGNATGELRPEFTYGHLTSLIIDISEFNNGIYNPTERQGDHFFNSFEVTGFNYVNALSSLTSAFSEKYGNPEIISDNSFKWKKGQLNIDYNYQTYHPYGDPLLHSGSAKIVYYADFEFKKQFFEEGQEKMKPNL
jgi:hypothetical protein